MSYNIAVAGKGGTGKTSLTGLLIDILLKEKKKPILVVDADANANINEVLDLKGLLVYVKRGILDIESDSYILSDLIGLDVYDNTKKIGTVKDYYLDNCKQKFCFIP